MHMKGAEMMRIAVRAFSIMAILLVVSLSGSGIAQAEDTSSSGSGEASAPTTVTPTYQTYQAPPVQVPSGAIIGYRPITNAQLEAALSGATPAPPAAVPAYATPGARSGFAATSGAGAVGGSAAGAGQLPTAYLTGVVGEGFYTLGRDDVIQIDVRNQPEFSGAFVIGFDGRIQYNYLGDIPVAGMTKYEAQQVLEKMLQKYVRVPQVNVMILAYNSKVVYVIGEVANQGKFIMRGDAIKLREAILAAGMPTGNAALSRVQVIKPDLENPEIRVKNVKRILYKGELEDDIDVHTGEVVVVPSTVWSKVNGFFAGLFSPVTRVARIAALAAL